MITKWNYEDKLGGRKWTLDKLRGLLSLIWNIKLCKSIMQTLVCNISSRLMIGHNFFFFWQTVTLMVKLLNRLDITQQMLYFPVKCKLRSLKMGYGLRKGKTQLIEK